MFFASNNALSNILVDDEKQVWLFRRDGEPYIHAKLDDKAYTAMKFLFESDYENKASLARMVYARDEFVNYEGRTN